MSDGFLLDSYSFWIAYFIIGYIVAVAIAMWIFWTWGDLFSAVMLGGLLSVAWPVSVLAIVMSILIGSPVLISKMLKMRRDLRDSNER